MLFQSEVVTAASGSVGGVTYSHNRSGMYRRSRAVPVNPNTPNQVQVRAGLTDAVTRWTNTLTQLQRDAWDLYGANTPTTNPLGAAIQLSGQNWYIGCNTPRLQAAAKLGVALARVDFAPNIFDRGDFTTPSNIIVDSAPPQLTVTFNNADDWATEVGSALLIYQGRPTNPSVNFFNGPWRLVAAILGAVAPPVSPAVIADLNTPGFAITPGIAMRFAFAVTRLDGRLTTRRISEQIIAT